MRDVLGRYPFGLKLWCVIWLLFAAVSSSSPGYDLVAVSSAYLTFLLWTSIWVVSLFIHLWKVKKGTVLEEKDLVYWLAEPLIFALGVGIILSDVTSHFRFFVSRPALVGYVESLDSGHIDEDQWVGLYKVEETEALADGVVRIITSKSGFDDAGFAFAPRSAPPVVGEDYYRGVPFVQNWYYWRRSW